LKKNRIKKAVHRLAFSLRSKADGELDSSSAEIAKEENEKKVLQ